VGVSVQFRGKVVKLIEVRPPSAEELQSGESPSLDQRGEQYADTMNGYVSVLALPLP